MKSILFLSFAILALAVDFSSAANQTLSLHTNSSCAGTPVKTTSQEFDSHSIPANNANGNETIRSAKVMGMWQVTHSGNSSVAQSTQGECFNLEPYNMTSGLVSLRRYGDLTMTGSGLNLYSQPTFVGNPTVVNPNANMTNQNINVQSYWFTGTKTSWMAYTGTNFNGTSTCIGPSDAAKRLGYGHTHTLGNKNLNMTIKSIKAVSTCPTNNAATLSQSLGGFVFSVVSAVAFISFERSFVSV